MIARLIWAAAAVAFPSVPRRLAAVAAYQSPGPVSSCGEADGMGPGPAPGGEGAPTISNGASGAPTVVERIAPRPPVSAQDPVVLISWHADRAATHLTDDHMAGVLAGWTKEHR